MHDRTQIEEMISNARSRFDGFNPPATQEDLSALQGAIEDLAEEVLTLYRDHNGCDMLPHRNAARLAARLMPVAEVLKTAAFMRRIAPCSMGNVTCLWTDDNSNYCCIYTSGPLRGWLTLFDHEEPILMPAYRSTASFMLRLLAAGPQVDHHDQAAEAIAYDLPSLARDVPELIPDPRTFEEDSRLSARLQQLYIHEHDEALRRLYAFSSICLTPYESTQDVLAFLEESNMWIPEMAIRLLELRRYPEAVETLEMVARKGQSNSSRAAIRHLARLDTQRSREAIARLCSTLSGQSLKDLERELKTPRPRLPARWP